MHAPVLNMLIIDDPYSFNITGITTQRQAQEGGEYQGTERRTMEGHG
jgi:hypothetical protein